mmetsp:Transcript_40138/g.62693  ORF Transcript_40138/g.62693 Transcript_40138/m.62693 type:complete len:81 (+) Transcript_40138:349-591(+)
MPIKMNLAYHTAGVPYAPKHAGSCLDPAFTKGCKNKGDGWVTLQLHKQGPSLACIRTKKGSGICWPGGKTGFNVNDFLQA